MDVVVFLFLGSKAHYLIVATVLSASARVSPSSDLTQ